MAVTVNLDRTLKGSSTADGMAYTRQYTIRSTTDLDESTALAVAGLPVVGEKHPTNNKAFVESVSVEEADGPKIWRADVNYAVPKGAGPHDEDDETTDPCDQRPVVSFGSASYTKVVDRAYDTGDTQGNPTLPIENSAGDPFDPPLQENFSRPLLNVKYNLRRFSPTLKHELENTINLTALVVAGFSVPALKGRIISIGCDPAYDAEDELYWQMSVQVEVNPDGYTRKVLDQGFYFLDDGDKTEITALDKDGAEVPVTEPQKLDGSGAKSTTPVFLSFKTLWAADWSPLNLPRSY